MGRRVEPTIWVTDAEVSVWFVSPKYIASMTWLPAASAEVENVALPLASGVSVAIVRPVDESESRTVPVGTPSAAEILTPKATL